MVKQQIMLTFNKTTRSLGHMLYVYVSIVVVLSTWSGLANNFLPCHNQVLSLYFGTFWKVTQGKIIAQGRYKTYAKGWGLHSPPFITFATRLRKDYSLHTYIYSSINPSSMMGTNNMYHNTSFVWPPTDKFCIFEHGTQSFIPPSDLILKMLRLK